MARALCTKRSPSEQNSQCRDYQKQEIYDPAALPWRRHSGFVFTVPPPLRLCCDGISGHDKRTLHWIHPPFPPFTLSLGQVPREGGKTKIDSSFDVQFIQEKLTYAGNIIILAFLYVWEHNDIKKKKIQLRKESLVQQFLRNGRWKQPKSFSPPIHFVAGAREESREQKRKTTTILSFLAFFPFRPD